MWDTIRTSWKTTLCGALALACEASALLEVLPDTWKGAMQGVCMTLVALGVIASKDGNVSHSPEPAEAKKAA